MDFCMCFVILKRLGVFIERDSSERDCLAFRKPLALLPSQFVLLQKKNQNPEAEIFLNGVCWSLITYMNSYGILEVLQDNIIVVFYIVTERT